LLAQEKKGLEAEIARLWQRKLNLRLRQDALNARKRTIDSLRGRLRTRADVLGFNRRVDEYNRLADQFNIDRRVLLDDAADLQRQVDAFGAKVRAANQAGPKGGRIFFDDNARKR
jgi:hypothetical protein